MCYTSHWSMIWVPWASARYEWKTLFLWAMKPTESNIFIWIASLLCRNLPRLQKLRMKRTIKVRLIDSKILTLPTKEKEAASMDCLKSIVQKHQKILQSSNASVSVFYFPSLKQAWHTYVNKCVNSTLMPLQLFQWSHNIQYDSCLFLKAFFVYWFLHSPPFLYCVPNETVNNKTWTSNGNIL